MSDIKDTIQKVLDEFDIKRAENKPTIFTVQYCPCGHSRVIKTGERDLLYKAMEHSITFLDALTIPSTECPICNK